MGLTDTISFKQMCTYRTLSNITWARFSDHRSTCLWERQLSGAEASSSWCFQSIYNIPRRDERIEWLVQVSPNRFLKSSLRDSPKSQSQWLRWELSYHCFGDTCPTHRSIKVIPLIKNSFDHILVSAKNMIWLLVAVCDNKASSKNLCHPYQKFASSCQRRAITNGVKLS